GASAKVLDIGCGCGGLGLALREKFGVTHYTGIEINETASATARKLNPEAKILTGDFLALDPSTLTNGGYDVVISLSCIDWNIGFTVMLPKAYALVKPGGRFVLSLRLTDGPTIDDPARSYQYINYAGEKEGEKANYVVLNAQELFARLHGLGVESISGFGFWGTPSVTAVTTVSRICFAVLMLHKGFTPAVAARLGNLRLPGEILALAGPA
ncbi:MAG: class I SAM-dependent methyltransferase, partial [Verrucomicrobia bacterium]|nr:class I SAM-dependent methyltransferase [Verrucomicrobiota bacterium]